MREIATPVALSLQLILHFVNMTFFGVRAGDHRKGISEFSMRARRDDRV